MANPTNEVDEWFRDRANPMEDAMQRVRHIVLGVDDRITETIKWQTPTFVFNGNIASFSPAKKLVSLMFHRGAEIPGDHPALDGDGRLVRTMRFADVDDVEAKRGDLEAVIAAWCALVEER
ncbi:MAG: DUF1801 domain-containing protein [Actinomycetota bacterium]